MLVSILHDTFEWGQFVHCESYDFAGCCTNMPCTRVSARAFEAFGTDQNLRLYLQKSHDLLNELSVQPEQKTVVQYRQPLQATIGWLRWHQTPIAAHEIGQAAAGFLVYYLRFFHKWIANAQLPSVFHLRYEDLVADPVGQLRKFLIWAGSEFDESRLEAAVERLAGIDAHTGQPRTRSASHYLADDYLQLFGPIYRRLLPRLAKFCPGLPDEPVTGPEATDAVDDMLDEWIFSVDLRRSATWTLHLADARQVVDHPSIRGRLQIPHAFGFGFSPPETGQGCWTDGDVCIVPFRGPVGARGLRVAVAHQSRRPSVVRFDRFDLDLVAEGRFCTRVGAAPQWPSHNNAQEVVFDLGMPSTDRSAAVIEGCLVIRFTGLLRSSEPEERRKLGLLLTSITFDLVDLPSRQVSVREATGTVAPSAGWIQP